MRKTREVLRLNFDLKLGQRQVARSTNISQSTVHDYLERFTAARLNWLLPTEMTEAELEAALFPADPGKDREPTTERPLPDFANIHEELQRHKHTTRQLLWEEYGAAQPDGYNYSRFCYLYQRWKQERDVFELVDAQGVCLQSQALPIPNRGDSSLYAPLPAPN